MRGSKYKTVRAFGARKRSMKLLRMAKLEVSARRAVNDDRVNTSSDGFSVPSAVVEEERIAPLTPGRPSSACRDKWERVFQHPSADAFPDTSDDESTQVFIPFISDVKIGVMDGVSSSVDLEEALPGSSPPGPPMERESTTPPSSPSMSSAGLAPAGGCPSGGPQGEAMDLQLDYWTLGPSARKGTEPSKLTLKAWFRSVQARLHSYSRREMVGIMRLGKKKERESDREARCQLVEGVHRLICSCRNLQAPLKGEQSFRGNFTWSFHMSCELQHDTVRADPSVAWAA
ncbi:hypothetical protein HPB47_004028 [Ixodes persulcatus]|uniref:Uncharacterized protein n=1 Tax=Ixodes persulcatus TaxID=34615 RepID=A0AC60PGZ2_IXOPE|nr:hypothetical protein HPB47_004028 [Ixodes persulcatus]